MGADFGYRGKRLGLPEEGPGAMTRTGRRVAALFIDWALCVVIARALIGTGTMQATNVLTLGIYLVMIVLLVGTLGFTPGKRMLRTRVVRLDGGRATFPQGLLRSVLLILVIPAAVWDRDTRGLHDKAVGTVEVRF